MDNFNLKKYLAENRLLKEEIDFPELEDEFEGYQDAMLGSDEEYLQGVIDATPEELLDLNGGYYEVALGVEQGRYSAEEAVKLAKAWAKDKLSGLAENNLLKEEVYVDFEDDLSEVTVYGFGQQFTGVETSDGKYYFIHYFDDVGGDDSVPFLFNHLEKIGGRMEIDEEEITLEIDYDNLRPLINENKLIKYK